MADEPELHEGARDVDRGDTWVTYLQGLLEAAGHSPGPIDGWFGPRTRAAVEQFQGANNCTVDGWVGPQTWGAINALGLTPVQPSGGGGGQEEGGDTDVPEELVQAGAPASFAQWTEDQKNAFFGGELELGADGDAPEQLEVAEIGSDGEGGSYT
jgi:hypothetical protein